MITTITSVAILLCKEAKGLQQELWGGWDIFREWPTRPEEAASLLEGERAPLMTTPTTALFLPQRPVASQASVGLFLLSLLLLRH